MSEFRVILYEKPNGKKPVEHFLDSLSREQRTKALKEIDILQERGSRLQPPASKHLRSGLFELRIKTSDNAIRVFFFFFHNKEIILTNGFIKKSQRTPLREIERGLRYMRDWKRRHR